MRNGIDQALQRPPGSPVDDNGTGWSQGGVVMVVAAGLFDTCLLLGTLFDYVSSTFALALHVASVLLLSVVLIRQNQDRSLAVLGGLGVMLMGPMGSIVTLFQMLVLGRAESGSGLDQTWFRSLSGNCDIDPAETLYEAIAQGRAYRPGPVPDRYAAVMASGSVTARQGILGQIVRAKRAYPPELLRAGLTSRDVAVRASAAAVYAKLREGGERPSDDAREARR